MELHYEVQIDTKKAQIDVEDLESVFEKMGASTEKSIQRLATWGKEITQDMKDGKITTSEATQSIVALQNEIRRLSVSEQGLGNESRAQLRQANQGLTVLGQSVRKLERTRTQAHTQNMRQLKEQERERKKIEAMDRREEARNKRMNIAASRRLGNAIKGAGASGLGSAVGSIAGMAKFGVAGVGIAGVIEAFKRFFENFGDSIKKAIAPRSVEKDFANAVEDFKKAVNFLIKKVIEGKDGKDASIEALNESIESRRANIRQEQVEQEKRVAMIHEENLDIKKLKEAIGELRRVPALSGLTNEQLVKGNKEQQIKAVRDYYIQREANIANTEINKEITKINKIYDAKIKALRLSSIPSSLVEDFENLRLGYKSVHDMSAGDGKVHLSDRLIEAYYPDIFSGLKKGTEDWSEMMERLREGEGFYPKELVKEMEAQLDKVNKYYDSLTDAQKEDSRIMRDINAKRNAELAPYLSLKERKKAEIISDNELARYTENANKAKERLLNYEKAMQAINGIAKADKGSTYGELLVNANETKKAQLAQLAKYKRYANTEEYQKALARIDAQFKDSVDEVNKIVGDMFDEIDSKFEESSENSLQKTRRNIHDAYEKMRKELKDFLELEEVYEDRERKLNELENRALEDADLEHSLKMIVKESEAKENAIKTSTKYLDEEERENDIKREQIASIEKQIEAIEKQNHVSEEERDMLEQLRMQWSMLRHEIEQTAEERKKYYDEERRLAIVEGITNIGGTLSSSSNPYVSSIGSLMGNFSGIQDIQRLRAQQLQFLKAEDQAWLNGDLKGAEAARAGARASKAQATASAVSAAVQFGSDVFNAFADSAEQGRQALEEWNAKLADSAHQLALLTIEEYEYKQRNIFGVDDPYKKMQASIDKERVAQQEAAKALTKMANEGIVQVGTKKKAEGKTVAQIAASGAGAGALIGAAAGSAATPVGTIIGTAAGAIVGAVTGIFASRKEVAIYDSLKAKYGEVYNKETLEINKQILADYGKMDEATKKLVDNAKELLAKQKEAHEEFLSYIQDMVGTMGSDISNILVNAFRSRDIKTAMDDLKGYLTQTIEGVLQKEVFGLVFGDAFDSLKAQLNAIKNEDGQIVGKIDEPISSFIHNIEDGMAEYADLMNQLQEKYKRYGYDIFTDDMEAQQEAMQGAISGMTEETAGKINGNFMGLKLTAMEVSDKVSAINNLFDEANRIARASLDALNAIAENTAFCQRLERLSADIADIKNNGLICR
jgi:hypothetical protein